MVLKSLILPTRKGLDLGKFEAERQKIADVSLETMQDRCRALRHRAKSGEDLERLELELFAMVREVVKRLLNIVLHDVQMMGAMAMARGRIAEMATGEGKTLTAILPLSLFALTGRGVHLATANDYLASRDHRTTKRVFQSLGFTTGVVENNSTQADRRKAYSCDITYGTGNQFGFDFLRDRLLVRCLEEADQHFGQSIESDANRSSRPVQRGLHFVLVDEADSVLIDEARTPLIIGTHGAADDKRAETTFRWAAETAKLLVEGEHYSYKPDKRLVRLSSLGRDLVRRLSQDVALSHVGLVDLYRFIERAINVERNYRLDEQYVVQNDEVMIVDELTGRYSAGRRWQAGVHQAVEAKEGLALSRQGGVAARITVQDFFRQYGFLAGMTGTASESAAEFRRVYGASVQVIPPNRPSQRVELPPRIFVNEMQKWNAVAEEIAELHAQGRAVLVGTRSVEKSEQLSSILDLKGLEHQVLNARRHEHEAEIVAQAGTSAAITVATNMAGRGTDIKLSREVRNAGGLHVILTELHESPRIDRQLIGRCARQGDPGSWRQFLSWEDDILKQHAESSDPAGYRWPARALHPRRGTRGFRRAQRQVEKRNARSRYLLLYTEKQRKKQMKELGCDPILDMADLTNS